MQRSRMIEALLFASEAPLTAADLARVDDSLDEEQVEGLIAELRQEYEAGGRAFDIVEIADKPPRGRTHPERRKVRAANNIRGDRFRHVADRD